MTDIFEKASRVKLRFASSRGLLSVEDLWDLPLQAAGPRDSLDRIAIDLNETLSKSSVSFVDAKSEVGVADALRFEIVKHIIGVKIAERDNAANERAKAMKKQQLLALLEKKQNEKLEGASEDEIRTMLADLS
jgi:hypothetical protein